MRPWLRALTQRFGITAPQVAVRTTLPWYWRVAVASLMLALGYGLAYWQFVGRHEYPFDKIVAQQLEDAQAMQAKVVHLDSQLQVTAAAQNNLAKEMASMQDENMRMKEEVAFYKSILTEGGATGVPKIHSIKLSKGTRAGEYQYQILLVQSGRHDKMVQGGVKLVLNGTQNGKLLAQHVEPAGQHKGIKVNFKYYQRIEGAFSFPPETRAESLQVQFFPAGEAQSSLNQTANFPN